MTALYKCVREDGMDFFSGTVDWAAELTSGQPVMHPRSARYGDMRGEDAGTYLSASTVVTDCTGMRWPCRLLMVRPVGRTVRSASLPNKRGARGWLVVGELPAVEALGPQGEQVAALIERCRTLTADEAHQLDAAWGAAWDAAWGAARGAAWALVVRDLIPAATFDALHGPWRSVVGPHTPATEGATP